MVVPLDSKGYSLKPFNDLYEAFQNWRIISVQRDKNLTALYDRIIAAIGAIKRSRRPSGSYLDSKIGLWSKKKMKEEKKLDKEKQREKYLYSIYRAISFLRIEQIRVCNRICEIFKLKSILYKSNRMYVCL